MIALDTNILVHAHRRDSPWHGPAGRCLRGLANGRGAWAIPWPCLHEFVSVVTHPRVYVPPSPLDAALDQLEAWMESPTLTVLREAHDHWSILRRLLLKGQIRGPKVHDARVAALCIGHGVSELLTADRDFSRFPTLSCRNPLVS